MRQRRRAFLGSLCALPLFPALAEGQGAAAPPPEAPPAAEGLLAAARAQFGHHLSPPEVEELRGMLAYALRSAEKLRSVALTSADEPVTVFEARPRAARPRR
jgi:hypothetical protein